MAAMQQRIRRIIEVYAGQGDHRTGTAVDQSSAEWLAGEIASLGVEPLVEAFAFKRVQTRKAALVLSGYSIPGEPLHDCSYTDAAGIAGRLGPVGSDAAIGVMQVAANNANLRDFQAARRANRHRAMVLVAEARMPKQGPVLYNAEDFRAPFGPPVLQFANEHWPLLQSGLQQGIEARVIAHCERVDGRALNLGARIPGRSGGAPLVVMTPRSGWWSCASERGGGIACWLEILRHFAASPPARPVLFTANTGHELGHLGLDHFLEQHPTLIRDALLWIHLGANFAAAVEPAVRLQFSDEASRAHLFEVLGDLRPAMETPIGVRPAGEARNIFDGGGRYLSILGGNGLFHHPDDRFPAAVDLAAATAWTAALVEVARRLAG